MFGGGFNFSGVMQNASSPGTVLLANNGLSKNPANTAVLGQDIAEPGNPAALLNNREIPCALFSIALLGVNYGLGSDQIIFNGGCQVHIQADAFNGATFPEPAFLLTDLASGQVGSFELAYSGLLEPMIRLTNNFGSVQIFNTTGQVSITPIAYEIAPPAAIFFNVTGNSRLNGSTQTLKPVDSTGAGATLSPDQSRTIFAQVIAGAPTYNLPPTLPGLTFGFYCGHAGGLFINPFGAEQIRITATLGAAGAAATSTTVGDYIELTCMVPGEWVATVVTGTGWTV